MLDKLLELLLNHQARRMCHRHGHRPALRELRYPGRAELRITTPCIHCGDAVPVRVVSPDAMASGEALPIVLRAVGGRAGRIAGDRPAS